MISRNFGSGMSEKIQQKVVRYAPGLASITPARTGNLSVRRGDRFAVTPTGVPYDEFDKKDVPVLNLEGEKIEGEMEPTSEVPMHTHIYSSLEAGAIVHAHSTYATTLAVLGKPLEPVHYMIVPMGDRVPVADYATYGTEELAENILSAMKEANSSACLISNHGMLTTGEDIESAFENAVLLENLSRIYYQALQAGKPRTLDRENLEKVREKFETYGQSEG